MAVIRRVIGNDFHMQWPLYRVSTNPTTGQQQSTPLDLTDDNISNVKLFVCSSAKRVWKQTNLYQIQKGEEQVDNVLDVVVKGNDTDLQREGFLDIKIIFDEVVDVYVDNVKTTGIAQRVATEERVVKLVTTTQEAMRDNSEAGFVDEDGVEIGGVITIQGYTFQANTYIFDDVATANANDSSLKASVDALVDAVLEMQTKGVFTSALVHTTLNKPLINEIHGNDPTPVVDKPGAVELNLDKTGDVCTLSMTATNSDKIYYTTDGSVPSSSSTLYTAPVTLTETATIRAIAYKGTQAGDLAVVTSEYNADQTAAQVKVSSTSPMTYTTDGSTPTASSPSLANNTVLSVGSYKILSNSLVSDITITA